MRVSDLIAILKTKNPDLLVMVNGYEGGVQDVEASAIVEGQAYINANEGLSYVGEHEQRIDYDYHCSEDEEEQFREKHPLKNILLLSR